jgi:Holliday junction DNA helicase RuvA
VTIARLKGIVEEIGLDGVLIDVGGVGYLVQVSTRTRSALPGGNTVSTLFIETQIREDAVTLFGFIDRMERDWFRTLTTVQGVGGKVALNILSVVEPVRLAQVILAQDKAQLARADGVGPKLATRLVTELKDKAAQFGIASAAASPGIAVAVPVAPAAGAGLADDAVSALVNLGYRRPDAMAAVAVAAKGLGDGADLGTLIRSGLKELAS